MATKECDDKSDIKIKEKLNLHVKKRLQENGKEASLEKNDSKDRSIPANTAAAPSSSAAPPRAKRQKTTKSSSKQTTNASVAGTGSSIASTATRSNDLLLSPGAANSNDTTNSSINSTDQDGELNDRDTCDKGDKGAGKSNQRVDIFAMILNQKKSSLLCDPEVIQFMKNLTEGKK
uniref:Uncharacterized protein n=1 Tax=Anopheles coluzzii TaxID=1518534 RepID=A0A8W7PDS1_ANOCL